MSLVLAPIHETMYQKVSRQDNMSEALLNIAYTFQWIKDLHTHVDLYAPKSVDRPLE